MNSPIQYGNYDAEASDNLIDCIHIKCATMYQISDLRYNTGILMQSGGVFKQISIIHACTKWTQISGLRYNTAIMMQRGLLIQSTDFIKPFRIIYPKCDLQYSTGILM